MAVTIALASSACDRASTQSPAPASKAPSAVATKPANGHGPSIKDLIAGTTPIARGATGSGLPSDDQIMRDAELAKWRALDARVRNPKIAKELDKYEKDETNVVVAGKASSGGIVRVFLTYQRRADFWKLKSLTSRIYP